MVNPADINAMYNEDFKKDPFLYFQEALENQPIVEHTGTLAKPYSVFRYEDVVNVLKTHQKFSNAGGDADMADLSLGRAGENITTIDPPRHTRLRRMAQQGFLPTVLNSFAPNAVKLAKDRVDYALEQGEIDIVDDFGAQITVGMITAILGLPADDWSMIRKWTVDIAENVTADLWVSEFEADRAAITERVTGEMADYFRDYIAARKKNPQEGDLVSLMISTEVEGDRFTDEEIESMAMLLLLAGNDTTTNLIGNYLTYMANYPDQADMVRKDPSLVSQSIEEVLRMAPSTTFQVRYVKEPVEMHGMTLEPGRPILPWMAAANRDPGVFENPNDFNIHRKPNRHIAFGFGPHMCLGAPLARLEGRIAIEEVMKRTKAIELIGPAEYSPNAFVFGPTMQRARFVAI